jgi:hypothetical protein
MQYSLVVGSLGIAVMLWPACVKKHTVKAKFQDMVLSASCITKMACRPKWWVPSKQLSNSPRTEALLLCAAHRARGDSHMRESAPAVKVCATPAGVAGLVIRLSWMCSGTTPLSGPGKPFNSGPRKAFYQTVMPAVLQGNCPGKPRYHTHKPRVLVSGLLFSRDTVRECTDMKPDQRIVVSTLSVTTSLFPTSNIRSSSWCL